MEKPGPAIRLEVGAGKAPKEGYMHNDINKFDHIEYVGNAWEIPLPPNSVLEVLTCGVVEHLTRSQVGSFLIEAHRLLVPGGILQFDMPDIRQWCRYLYDCVNDRKVPFSADHIFANFWGWQRWPGDEHKWGWTKESICKELLKAGFDEFDVLETDYGNPEKANLCCKVIKEGGSAVIPTYDLLKKPRPSLSQAVISKLARSFLAPVLRRPWKLLQKPSDPPFALYPNSPDNYFTVSISHTEKS